jgi:hypothetical protein
MQMVSSYIVLVAFVCARVSSIPHERSHVHSKWFLLSVPRRDKIN